VVCKGSRCGRNDSLIVVFDFARNPLFCGKDEGMLPSGYVKSGVLNYYLPDQPELSNVPNIPFPVCIDNARENVESRKYYNFFKWIFPIPMCSLLFFTLVKTKEM
jgi:hypothetical protein